MKASVDVGSTRRGIRTKSLEERLANLYSTHGPGAIRLAFLLTGDRGSAEDICQEAFVRVGGRLGGLRDPERASGYLFRTVVNLSRGHGRRLRRDRELVDRIATPPASQLPDLAQHDEVTRALMQLPVRQRAAVFCRYFQDLTEAQTAEVLNCSVSAARSLAFRAMETMRKHLQEEDR